MTGHTPDGGVPECLWCGKPLKEWKDGEQCPDNPNRKLRTCTTK